MLTYTAKLLASRQEDLDDLMKVLVGHQAAFNLASIEQFGEKKTSIVVLHSKAYKKIRAALPDLNSQVAIRAINAVLAAYRTAKSNKHKLKVPATQKNLSLRLDKRIYSLPTPEGIRITTASGRKNFRFHLHPKLKALLQKFTYCDPLLYVDNGAIYIALSFDNKPKTPLKQKLALGVDLGVRRSAATSDGRLLIDRKFNGDKRKLRHLKDCLKSKGTKSARRHLRKLRHAEHNRNKNQTHLLANEILKTEADTIVLENLKGIKVKKHKYQNKRSISQVPLYELRRVITYKAENLGKTVSLVCPSYTSQRDCVSGRVEGERRGCRFLSTNGLVYDADINAAINIGKTSKLPVSQTNRLTYGQAHVIAPIVYKSLARVPHKPPNLFGGE